MAKSNIKLLTKDERKFFHDNYTFEHQGNCILVKFKDYGRVVAHPIDKSFNIVSRVRKITISTNAISLWIEKFKDTKYSVVDIQNAINALIIGYQHTEYEEVKTQLNIIDDKDTQYM